MKKIFLSAILLLSINAFSDTIAKFDSAMLNHTIVNTANAVISAIPATNPIVEALKIFFIAIGGAVTGYSIHFFKKKNEKK